MRYHRSLIVGVATLALLGSVGASPAQADTRPTPLSLYAPTALVLGVGHGENSQHVQRAATLRCNPTGGDHPDAAEACAALDGVRGDFRRLSGEDGMCTKEYRPVTVTVNGVWRGRLTQYRQVFSNRCMLIRAKGTVFDF